MTAHSISWAPLIPWAVVIGLGAVAVAFVLLAWHRGASGAPLRALGYAVLLLVLTNPSLLTEDREPIDDLVIVVADRSQSHAIEPRTAQTDEALAHLVGALDELEATEVQLVEGADGGIAEAAGGTRLFEALGARLRSLPRDRVAAVLMVSDGQIHDIPASLAGLDIEAPIHLLLTGREGETDRRLVVREAPSFAIIGKSVPIAFTVEDQGPETDGGTWASVTISQDGQALETFRAPLGIEQKIEVTLTRRGVSLIEIEAEPAPGELSAVNNRAAVLVHGVRDRLKVLLVSGEPHPGERAWRNILKSDPAVDLVHFTILRPPEKQDGTPIRELSLIAFPTRELFEVKLHEFDLVIFDRYRRRGVLPSLYLDNIARYVEQGGAMLEAVGPTFATPLSIYRTPLGRILPGEPTSEVFEQPFRPRLTDIGNRHPVTRALRPAESDPTWGRWFRQVAVHKRSGHTLMDGVEEQPSLILSRVGDGRVAQILSDHMWLWSRGFDGGGPQTELLRRIAHWLMKEPELEEEVLRAEILGDRLAIERHSLNVEMPNLEVTTPSGESRAVELQEIEPGIGEAQLQAEELGLYRITDGEHTALAAAGPLNPKEFEDLRASAHLVDPLIETSGGGVIPLASADLPSLRKVRPGRSMAGRGWLGIESKGRYVVTGVSQTSLLPAILVLLAAITVLFAAWYREGR
jgi:hypothetical protein